MVKGLDRDGHPVHRRGPARLAAAPSTTAPRSSDGGPSCSASGRPGRRRAPGGSAVVLGLAIVGEAGIGKTRVGGGLRHRGRHRRRHRGPRGRVGRSQPTSASIHCASSSKAGAGSAATPRRWSGSASSRDELERLGFSIADYAAAARPGARPRPRHGLRPGGSRRAEVERRHRQGDRRVSPRLPRRRPGRSSSWRITISSTTPPATSSTGSFAAAGTARSLTITTREQPPHRTEVLELGPLSVDACKALADAIVSRRSLTADAGRPRGTERRGRPSTWRSSSAAASSTDAVDPIHRPARSAASTVPDVLYEPLDGPPPPRHRRGWRSRPPRPRSAATVDLDLLRRRGRPDRRTRCWTGFARSSTRRDPRGRPRRRSTVRFRHELIRDVAYDLLPPTRRRDVHSRVGRPAGGAGHDQQGVDWPIVASHLERADRAARGGRGVRRGPATRLAAGATSCEARHHLGQAIDLVLRAPSSART